ERLRTAPPLVDPPKVASVSGSYPPLLDVRRRGVGWSTAGEWGSRWCAGGKVRGPGDGVDGAGCPIAREHGPAEGGGPVLVRAISSAGSSTGSPGDCREVVG